MVDMRTNGEIYFQLDTSSGGFDDNGNPIAVTEEWGDAVPAHIVNISENLVGATEGGTFHIASYRILIEGNIDSVDAPQGKKIQIIRHGVNLGTFVVISSEKLTSVGRIRILV